MKREIVSYLYNVSVTHDSSSEYVNGLINGIIQGLIRYKFFARINFKLKENKAKLKRLVKIFTRSDINSFTKIDPVSWTSLHVAKRQTNGNTRVCVEYKELGGTDFSLKS
jgi:hypothetical protein